MAIWKPSDDVIIIEYVGGPWDGAKERWTPDGRMQVVVATQWLGTPMIERHLYQYDPNDVSDPQKKRWRALHQGVMV